MSRKSIKRIKLETDGLKLQPSGSLEELSSRPSSPEKGLRTPQNGAALVNLDLNDCKFRLNFVLIDQGSSRTDGRDAESSQTQAAR